MRHSVSRTGDVATKQTAVLPKTAQENGFETAIFTENPSFSPKTGFGYHIDTVHDNIQRKPYPSAFSPRDETDALSVRDGLHLAKEVLMRDNRLQNLGNTAYAAYSHFSNREPSYPHNGEWVIRHLQSYLEHTESPTLTVSNILDPHNPYWGSPPSQEMSRPEREKVALRAGGFNFTYMLTNDGPPEEIMEAFGGWDEFFAAKESTYQAFSREADRLVGKFRDQQQDTFEDSLVVVLGDHGQLFGTDGMFGHHNSLHPHGIHVPLMIDPPAPWDCPELSIDTPVSIAGLGQALIQVVADEIETTDELIAAIAEHSQTADGSVIVCADGPTWSLPELYDIDQLNTDRIDELAVRRVGYIRDEFVEVYTCPWESTDITCTSYVYTADDRKEVTCREPPELSTDAKDWLEHISDPRTQRQTPDDARLKALGYAQ